MIKKVVLLLFFTLSLFLSCTSTGKYTGDSPTPEIFRGPLGVTMGFERQVRDGGPYVVKDDPIYNVPMFKVPSEDKELFWDDIVEQLDHAGVDFVAPVLRGHMDENDEHFHEVLNGHGDPRMLTKLVEAIERRGLQEQIKISCLDDIPASWTAKKNLAIGNGYRWEPKFDLADESLYIYIWERNLQPFFKTVPDELRFKIDGRPVIYLWQAADLWMENHRTEAAGKALRYIKERSMEEFGFEPYIIVHRSWERNHRSTKTVADGIHDWFHMNNGWTNYKYKKNRYGIAIPEFNKPNENSNMIIDPEHGRFFESTLQKTVDSGALVTMVEGFTDFYENAAMWRAKEAPYEVTHYDYPNQRLNILRKYSSNPFPANRRIDAETADSYYDTTQGNRGIYRDGDLDIENCTDSVGGWNVTDTEAGEWLEWKEIPLNGPTEFKVRIATEDDNASLRFIVDGEPGPVISLPNTGGLQSWQTIDAGSFDLEERSYHTVRIEFLSSGINLNYWSN